MGKELWESLWQVRSESIRARSNENPKIKFEKTLGKLMQKTGIRILSYHLRNISGLSNMSTYDALKTAYTQFKDKMIDLLWHLAYFLRSVTRKAKFYV